MKKTLSLLLIFSLSLLMLIGCGKSDSPTTVVNNYFSKIKSQSSSDLTENLVSSFLTNEDESTTKEVKDAISQALSKLKVEPQKETVDYSSASVSVTVNGISMSSVMNSLIDELQNSPDIYKLSKDDLSKKITEILIDKIKNADTEERTGQLNLKNEKDKWILVTDDDSFLQTVWGITKDQVKSLRH